MIRRRILVVDDDREMVQTLSDILELRGWDTLKAYDGADAMASAMAFEPDVVLMDVKMPRVDGVQALSAMKAARPAMRVVLMTAYAAHDLLLRAAREGALSILRKPVELPELLNVLDDAMLRARSVLMVDDDPAALLAMGDALADRGMRSVVARSLNEALTLLRRDPPGVVLLDLKLDGVDPCAGMVAIKEVNPTVLLVLLSAQPSTLAETIGQTPPGLVDAAFTKPLPVDELLTLIDGHVAR
jgi:DNA-binding NtrC family response regulator